MRVVTHSDHAALSRCYPGEFACLTRWHTGHHSGVPSCTPQPCGLPHCLSLKCPVRIKSPPRLNRYPPQSFLRRRCQGNWSQYHSRWLESPQDDPVSDSDSVGLELPKLNALESEECGLNLEPQERRF